MEKRHKCNMCKKMKARDEFYFNSSRNQPVHSRCKECEKERSKSRREYFRNYMRKNRENNPDKWKARKTARENLEKEPCIICGSEKSEAHHPDYEHPLIVVWLCHKHHWQVETGRLILNPHNTEI